MYAYGHIRWLEESIRMRRDEEEERSISPNPVEVKIVNDGIMFYFMKPLDNVFIQIVDDSGMLVYEESVPLSTSQSYCISRQWSFI